jgi:hypothetical protein
VLQGVNGFATKVNDGVAALATSRRGSPRTTMADGGPMSASRCMVQGEDVASGWHDGFLQRRPRQGSLEKHVMSSPMMAVDGKSNSGIEWGRECERTHMSPRGG